LEKNKVPANIMLLLTEGFIVWATPCVDSTPPTLTIAIRILLPNKHGMGYTFYGQGGDSVKTPETPVILYALSHVHQDDGKAGKKEQRYIMILQNNYEYHQDKFNFMSINYETGIFDSYSVTPVKKKFFY
jgi:hypothetical protein